MSADGSEHPEFSDLLVKVGASQCRQSYAVIFNHFAPRLKTYLCKQGAEAAQAEELIQDVMMTVWRKAAQYDPAKASPATWIFRIARNRSIDAFRKRQRPEIDADDPVLLPPAPVLPEPLLLRRELGAAVRAEMANLTLDHRDLLRAAFYEGMSHSEIAEKFDLPLGTVKSRLRSAFAKLRDNLAGRNKM